MKPIYSVLLISSALLLSACAPMGGREGPNGGSPGGGREMGMGRDGGGNIVSDLQERLQHTAEALKLNPRQAVLWDAYQERVGALMADQMKLQAYRSHQTAMQHIGQKVDTVRLRLAAMEDIQEAAAKLYDALDETQKTTADQLLPQTVPALYSGITNGGNGGGRGGDRQDKNGGRGGMGGTGGGMGGGGMGRS